MISNSNPTAVITGASSGFGKAVTEKLLSEGWNVCMIARSYDKMEKIALNYVSDIKNESRIKIIVCDVLVATDIINVCKQIKLWSNDNINFLFNNVGGLKGFLGFDTTTSDDLDYAFKINVKSAYLFTQNLVSALQNGAMHNKTNKYGQYDGCIINLSSVVSSTNEVFNHPYQIAKAAMNKLTKLSALALSEYKIRVNDIAPSVIPTPIHTRKDMMGMDEIKVKNLYDGFARITPLGKTGDIKDVVEMVLFLINKNKSGWFTGQILTLDGGLVLKGAMSML